MKSPQIAQQKIIKYKIINNNKALKLGIWVYFFLLIFEGALRKWVFPSLEAPLLVVRDPVAIILLIVSWRQGLLPFNRYMIGMMLIGLFGIYTAVLLGHGNLLVAIYGSRILLIHFPLIFLIGEMFNRDDVIKVGKVLLWLSIPMAILVVLQFYSPQSAWVNRGVGGNLEGAGFSGALGYFRPPATFSFINGNTLFFGLVAPFVLFFWFNNKSISKVVLILATISLLIAIPFSISRTLLFSVGITIIFSLLAATRNPIYISKFIFSCFGIIITLTILSQIEILKPATEAFTYRFVTANESEGGLEGVLGDRYLGGMIKSITSTETPLFGHGIGIGTSVGGKLLSGKQTLLIYAEDEWARLIGEQGLLMGLGVILLRLILSISIAFRAYQKLKSEDLLPWLLLSFGLLNIPQGQWMQPTALGFGVLIGGLLLASMHSTNYSVRSSTESNPIMLIYKS